jgi:hypothetical protein
MFCFKCGNEVKDGAKFCANCGQAVNDAPKENAAPTNQPQAEDKGLALIGLILGVVSFLGIFAFGQWDMKWIFVIPFILGIVGINISAKAISLAKKAGQHAIMAVWGIVLSILGILLLVLKLICP